MYEAKIILKHKGFVLSSKQAEYKPKQLKGVVLYDFGGVVFRLRDDGLLIFDKDELLQNKTIIINGRKVASGRKLEGKFKHTGLKPQPVIDEDIMLNLIDTTNLSLRQYTPSVAPKGEQYKKVYNVYIELVNGKPKFVFQWDK